MIEEESGRLLKHDGIDQWVHYNTSKTIYTRRCHKSYPKAPGISVKVSVLPVGYKVLNNNQVTRRKLDDQDIASALRWAKTSVGHVKCNDRGKFTTSWKSGSNIRIGTDGGLKDNLGTTGIVIEMEDDINVKLTAMSAE